MQPERWQRIESLFQSALDCAPDQRSALLTSACGDDEELRHEVESLLALNEESGFTDSSAFEEGIRSLERRSGRMKEERTIGVYRVLREIGRGGMGTVYLAARADDEFQKLAAIKIIRRGLDTDDIIERFRRERQILATLDHPNIARLLDGGTTDDGLPYFVMEYIAGEPSIVVKNQPGAGGMVMANALYTTVPRDGLTIGMMVRDNPLEPVLGNPAAKFRPESFTWLGTSSRYEDDAFCLVVRSDTGITSIADLRCPYTCSCSEISPSVTD